VPDNASLAVTAHRFNGLADRLGDCKVLVCLGNPLRATVRRLGERDIAAQDLKEPPLLEKAEQHQVQR